MFWYTFSRARFSSLACKKSWCETQPFEEPTCNKPIQQEKQSYNNEKLPKDLTFGLVNQLHQTIQPVAQ